MQFPILGFKVMPAINIVNNDPEFCCVCVHAGLGVGTGGGGVGFGISGKSSTNAGTGPYYGYK